MKHRWVDDVCTRCGMYRQKRREMMRRVVFGRRQRTVVRYYLNGRLLPREFKGGVPLCYPEAT